MNIMDARANSTAISGVILDLGTNSSTHTVTTTRGVFPLRLVLYTICFIGIVLNSAVFLKRKNMSRQQSSTTRLSLSLLCAMAAADTISLAALLVLLSTKYLSNDPQIMDRICKIDLFLIHSASAFSIWCWLVLSAVRYMAVYRPYTHLRLNSEPKLAVAAVAVLCATLEAWILVYVNYIPESRMCGEQVYDEQISFRLQLFEIGWTYFFPVLVITVLDARVLFCRSVWFNGLAIGNGARTSLERAAQTATVVAVDHDRERRSKTSLVIQNQNSLFESALKGTRFRRRAAQLRVLRRCLCITVLDLGMNLPNYLYRLWSTLISEDQLHLTELPFFQFFEDISTTLYFAQFSLNAFYLVCIIYDSPKRDRNCSKSEAASMAGATQQRYLSGNGGSFMYPSPRTVLPISAKMSVTSSNTHINNINNNHQRTKSLRKTLVPGGTLQTTVDDDDRIDNEIDFTILKTNV